jgi:hypothetical protein
MATPFLFVWALDSPLTTVGEGVEPPPQLALKSAIIANNEKYKLGFFIGNRFKFYFDCSESLSERRACVLIFDLNYSFFCDFELNSKINKSFGANKEVGKVVQL